MLVRKALRIIEKIKGPFSFSILVDIKYMKNYYGDETKKLLKDYFSDITRKHERDGPINLIANQNLGEYHIKIAGNFIFDGT
jgi:hypothetical protein